MVGGSWCGDCGAGACLADSTTPFGELYSSCAEGSVPRGWLDSGRSGGPSEYPHPFSSHTSSGSKQVELTWDLHPTLGRGFRAQQGGVHPVWGAGRAQPSLGTGDVPKNAFEPCMGILGPAMRMVWRGSDEAASVCDLMSCSHENLVFAV